MKRCRTCRQQKPLADFYLHPYGRDGADSKCKRCMSTYYKERYVDKKEEKKAAVKQYKKMSPRPTLWRNLKRLLKHRPTESPVNAKYLCELFETQNGCCAVSGVKMTWAKGHSPPTTLSIDRIDQSKGYEMGNVRLVCYQVNTFRGRWSDTQMLEMARAIVAKADATSPTWKPYLIHSEAA